MRLLKTHTRLISVVINDDLLFQRSSRHPINKTQTFPPLSQALFHFSSMMIKKCCVLYDFRNPILCFDSLFCL